MAVEDNIKVIAITGFGCGKASLDVGVVAQKMVRIAQRLNALEFIDQEDVEKLPTFNEMKKKPRQIVNGKDT